MKYNDEDEEEIKEIELNDKQADFLEAICFRLTYKGLKKSMLIGGIGSGKSVVLANALKMIFEELPRAKVQFATNAVKQAKRSLTPGIKAVWRDFWNAYEFDPSTGEGEFIFWKKPPQNWVKPYEEPDSWDNCITHIGGAVVEFCGYSQDPDSHRSRNDDILIIDEASRFKREWLKVAEGRVRANVGKFDSNLHHLCMYFSNPNYDPAGDWMWDLEELANAEPDRYCFVHTCTMDNLAFLPNGYVEDKKKTMHDLEFRVEVMGERVTRIKNSYYSGLNWQHHSAILDDEQFHNPYYQVVASVDFNVGFTSCTLWQNMHPEHRCIANAFVKEAKQGYTMAESLAFKLDEILKEQKNKSIVVTGDRNGSNVSAGSRMKFDGTYETQFEQFCNVLTDLGWDVVLEPLNYNPNKSDIYNYINDILLENTREEMYLRFHPEAAKATLISMTYTPVAPDMKKDKRSERSKRVEQEYATHLGDTVDYYTVYVKHNDSHASTTFDIEFF